MGFFDSDDKDEDDELATQLAQSAKGQSVTADKLTRTTGYTTVTHLRYSPLIDYLNQGEQPHYFFHSGKSVIKRDGEPVPGQSRWDSGISSLVITDKRVIFFFTSDNYDRGEAVVYNRINDISSNKGITEHKITIDTTEHQYVAPVASGLVSGYSYDQVQEGTSYAKKQLSNENKPRKKDIKIDLDLIWEKTDVADESNPEKDNENAEVGTSEQEERDPEIEELVENAKGDTVSYEGLVESEIVPALDENEQPHFLFQGNSLLITTGGDTIKKGGMGKTIVSVVTDKRIICNIKQGGLTNIPLESVISTEYGQPPEDEWDADIPFIGEFSGKTEKLIINVQNKTYYIGLNQRLGVLPDSMVDESINTEPGVLANEIMEYIRNHRENNTAESQSDSDEKSPLEKIEHLKELHDQGAITEEEFNEKKENLLDEI